MNVCNITKRLRKALQSKLADAYIALRLIPSAAMRDDKVVGRKPSNSAAPPFPQSALPRIQGSAHGFHRSTDR